MKFVDPDSLEQPPRHVRIALADFLNIPAFPGHRDSEARATKAESNHLNMFIPQHAEVELAECPDPNRPGMTLRGRRTGHTRAAKWRAGKTDVVPTYVNATVYWCADLAAVSGKGLLLDSPKAAWKHRDYTFRAYSVVFEETWRPESALVKRAGRAILLAEAYRIGVYQSDRSLLVESVLPQWKKEVQTLDAMCQQPVSIEGGHISTGIMAGCLLLLKFEDTDLVRLFLQTTLADGGTKTAEGMDGVQCLAETIKARSSRRGKPSRQLDLDDVKKTLTAYLVFETDGRHQRLPSRIDPVAYVRAKLKQQQRDLPDEPMKKAV